MRTLATALAVGLASAVCGGCITTPPPASAPAEALVKYKRIGVVSMTAQVFSRVYTGLMVFINERDQIDSSSWDIDSKYEQQLATALSSLGGIEAVQGTYSRSEFFRLGYQKGSFDWNAIEIPTRNYCRENQVDAILVAFATESGDFVAGTNQRLSGAGFISGFKVPPRAYLHLVTMVALFDCQSAKPVAARGLSSLREGEPWEILRASPVVLAWTAVARAPLAQLTDEQVTAIKNSLTELPKRSWAPTLRAIFDKP